MEIGLDKVVSILESVEWNIKIRIKELN
jgi:hypothetical protein